MCGCFVSTTRRATRVSRQPCPCSRPWSFHHSFLLLQLCHIMLRAIHRSCDWYLIEISRQAKRIFSFGAKGCAGRIQHTQGACNQHGWQLRRIDALREASEPCMKSRCCASWCGVQGKRCVTEVMFVLRAQSSPNWIVHTRAEMLQSP